MGKIKNTLLAQTIPLYVSLQNSLNLGSLELKDYVVVTRDVECTTNAITGEPMEFQLDESVIDFLQSNDGLGAGGTDKYPATVEGLYMLANAYLGGQTPGNLSIGAVASTVDAINNAFDGCRAVAGWMSIPTAIVMDSRTTTTSVSVAERTFTEAEDASSIIKAFPNPFVDRVRFIIQPKVTGQVQLDILDITGRNLQTPFNGFMRAGQKQTVDVRIDAKLDATLIYRINTGGQTATGKLLRAKY